MHLIITYHLIQRIQLLFKPDGIILLNLQENRIAIYILPYANDDPIPGAQADKDGLLQRKYLLDRQ